MVLAYKKDYYTLKTKTLYNDSHLLVNEANNHVLSIRKFFLQNCQIFLSNY